MKSESWSMKTRMSKKVTLVYPYFRPFHDDSPFRFPPLGLGYIAAYLKKHGVSVDLVDCTFLKQEEALERVRQNSPEMIGIYSMYSMRDVAIRIAGALRGSCDLLVAGGPLPTVSPKDFLRYFDVVALGEGEETALQLAQDDSGIHGLANIEGIAYKLNGKIKFTKPRGFIKNLDTMPFPARELFDNEAYKNYYSKRFGYTITSLMTSRGCPFVCEFCSRPIFGTTFRSRSAKNIVDEIETVLRLGYHRIWFADDCFTLNRKRLLNVCDEMIQRGLKVEWECLSRVDTVDKETMRKMKQAGCVRLFFGIESGNDRILSLMKKYATISRAKEAVGIAKQSGVQVGAFFIVGYPGEQDTTILDTIRFASALPLDYLSFTMPYPIPGTDLYDRIKGRLMSSEWAEPRKRTLVKHKLLFGSPFSEAKLKFGILKGLAQHELRKHAGNRVYKLVGTPFEHMTDQIFKMLP
jgi:anaerobic magnesium-protoporphyrin IX monomethyl ester cyclase